MGHVQPQEQDTPPVHRLTDSDLLEIAEAIYEWAVWAADMGMVDFDTFADLSLVIAELRRRIAS